MALRHKLRWCMHEIDPDGYWSFTNWTTDLVANGFISWTEKMHADTKFFRLFSDANLVQDDLLLAVCFFLQLLKEEKI